MSIKALVYALSFLLGVVSNAQTESLQDIIGQDIDEVSKQRKIDLLLEEVKNGSDLRLSADYYHDVGSKWYFRKWRSQDTGDKKNLENAISFTAQAIAYKERLDSIDKKSLKKSLYNLGAFYNYNENVFMAVRAFEKLIALGESDEKTQAANREIAELYKKIGDYGKAEERLKSSFDYYATRKNRYDKHIEILVNLADLYSSMGFVQYAPQIIKNLRKAEILIEKHEVDYPFTKAQISQIYGNLYIELGDFEKALEKQGQLLSFQEYLSDEDLAIVYNSMGVCYLRLGDAEKSVECLMKSLSFDDQYSSPFENLGDVYMEQSNYTKGIEYYEKAVRLVTGVPENKSAQMSLPTPEMLELSEDKLSLLNHLVTQAGGWLLYYKHSKTANHLEQAIKTFKRADELINLIKGESIEDQSKFYWREQSSNLYLNAIEACFLSNNPQDAYYFMERNKALLLLEDLTQEEAKEITALPDEIAEREFELKRAIHLSENRLQQEKKILENKPVSSLKDTVFANKYRYKTFIDSLENSFPNYAKFKSEAKIRSLNELSNTHLENSHAVLYYVLNEHQGYALFIDKDSNILFELGQVEELNKNIEALIQILSSGNSDINQFKTLSHSIFEILMPDEIHQKILGKRLTIIPDYVLQQIPFETLVVDNNKLSYLFQEVEIDYAYSASLMEYGQQRGMDSGTDFLGLAPVTFDRLKLPELHFSEKEITSIASIFPGETYLNGQASKANFIKNASDPKIIHLATHADIGLGDNPWVAFSDSKMYLKEIYASKTQADMVVLSACNTALGELKRGEGVMSLARGFFYSGTKSVVSTLWPVSDESGKDILIDFYTNLDQGLTKSKALQKAKLDYLATTEEEELKHPYYWAGFVLLGDNSPLSEKSISPWSILGWGLLGTGILVFGYKKIKARRAVA